MWDRSCNWAPKFLLTVYHEMVLSWFKGNSVPIMRTRHLKKTTELSYWCYKISFRSTPLMKICCLHSQGYARLLKKSFVVFQIWLAAQRLLAILSLAGSATLRPKKLVQLTLQLFCCETRVRGQFVASPSSVSKQQKSYFASMCHDRQRSTSRWAIPQEKIVKRPMSPCNVIRVPLHSPNERQLANQVSCLF